MCIFLLLFRRSNPADFTGGGESVSQSQFLTVEGRPLNEERDTRIIKSTGSGTNAGKHSAPIAGLRCLHQESCLYQVLKGGSHFTGFALPHFCKRIVFTFPCMLSVTLLTYFKQLHLMTGHVENNEFCFPKTLIVSRGFVLCQLYLPTQG